MKKTFIIAFLVANIISVFAQEKPMPLVNVNGEHTIKVAPDIANVNFMISTTHENLHTAKQENDALVSKAISYLKTKLDEKDFRTTAVYLQPYTEYVKDEKPKAMFRAQQSLSLRLTNIEELTNILSELVALGVNNIQNVQFTSSKIKELQDQAREQAILDAKRKATILAKTAGRQLGAAFTINDNTHSNGISPRPMYMAYKASDMAENSVQDPIAAGEIDITANVQISFLMF